MKFIQSLTKLALIAIALYPLEARKLTAEEKRLRKERSIEADKHIKFNPKFLEAVELLEEEGYSSKKMDYFDLRKVDCTDNLSVCSKNFNVSAFPTILTYINGQFKEEYPHADEVEPFTAYARLEVEKYASGFIELTPAKIIDPLSEANEHKYRIKMEHANVDIEHHSNWDEDEYVEEEERHHKFKLPSHIEHLGDSISFTRPQHEEDSKKELENAVQEPVENHPHHHSEEVKFPDVVQIIKNKHKEKEEQIAEDEVENDLLSAEQNSVTKEFNPEEIEATSTVLSFSAFLFVATILFLVLGLRMYTKKRRAVKGENYQRVNFRET
ncbi:hypothetical protein HK099_007420 [Clydaea vesicula]|uniref:Uncharacterized protein n=1 Tax=Clydaea vesicula TaxID=447962 RepID=A0AAD5TWF7_9FUNG|nr:hypothetical protein HK099_007420 [Clydaea vesicula]